MIINVCIGSACHLKGSYEIINKLQELIKENGLDDKVGVKAAFCLGNCTGAVAVKVDDQVYSIQPPTTEMFFNSVVKGRI